MSHRFGKRLGLAALIVGMAGVLASTAEARPSRPRGRPQSAFQLFAASTMSIEINNVYCGLRAIGETCVDVTGSPVLGGGSWPRGSGDAYIFNSGLQVAGIVDPAAGFAWAGDTIGSWFMDPRGDQQSGEAITDIFSSLNADDAANWPGEAGIQDTALFNPVLIGRNTISQQDIWWRYWDGNPNQTAGRGHPAGILVEQRGLGWNFPSGNEDILYFITRFINVTADGAACPTAYDTLARFGYTDAQIDAIAAIGTRFQQLNEAKFGIDIPACGYTMQRVFAGVMMDPDVGTVVTDNFSTANLVFSLAFAYVGDFEETTWQYPSNIFSPPFGQNPGFVGVKYLQSPINPATGFEFGITMFSNTTNGGTFPDANGIQQLYRYLSGSASPANGDNACTAPNPQAQRMCALVQTQADTRFFASSGPFDLAAGDGSVFVTAYVHAAPVASAIAPYVGTPAPGLVPGYPPNPEGLLTGGQGYPGFADTVRVIDRATGWVSFADGSGAQPNVVEQSEVTVVQRSLLHKSLVAQAVFDNGFLLPFAPEAPEFYLVPGNNQVTVTWVASPTETIGDPYFAIASQPLVGGLPNPLYDPNYRNQDVEGYRIWRGRTPSQMQVIAQFDYGNTVFTDNNGTVYNAIDYGNQCAPELGLTTSCPTFPHDVPIATQIGVQPGLVQIPPGGRVVAAGNVVITQSDTAVSGGARCRGAVCPELTDNGVPFAFTDTTARNGYRYFYSVTAFDVNSVASVGIGNTSLESPLVTKATAARAPTPTEIEAVLQSGLFGDDNVALDPTASWRIDPATGRFSGSPPPTNSIVATFAPLVPALLPALSLTVSVDSFIVHSGFDYPCGALENGLGTCAEAFVTFNRDGVETNFSIPLFHNVWSSFGGTNNTEVALGNLTINADTAAERRFGLPSGFATFSATVNATLREHIRWSSNEGQASRRGLTGPASVSPGGSRWFDGTNETVDHPGAGIRVGHLTGIDTVWAPIHHTDTDPLTPGNQTYSNSGAMQCFSYTMAGLGRQADVQVTWGAGGTITSVRDVTHHVDVQFKPNPQATYGFVSDNNSDGVISWTDFNYLESASQNAEYLGFCGHTDPGPGLRATLSQNPVIAAVSTAGVPQNSPASTGTGFGMYINGERYIFQLTGGTPPAAGTVWTLRTYSGLVRAASSPDGPTPGGYTITRYNAQPMIPGLQVVFNVPQATQLRTATAADMDRIHTVPDPYYITHTQEISTTSKVLRFINLPEQAIIRIYSSSGILVNVLSHNSSSNGGDATWNLRNRNNQVVASGVYFYHVEAADGRTKVGRFAVVNYAQ